MHHTRVGGALCRAWKLPAGVIEAAEYHHDYRAEDGKTRFAAHLCAAADAIAIASMPGGHFQTAAEAPAVVELGVTSDKVAAIVQQVAAALPTLISASGVGGGHATGVHPTR
jgi:HD-like signal output (HDOD) protein